MNPNWKLLPGLVWTQIFLCSLSHPDLDSCGRDLREKQAALVHLSMLSRWELEGGDFDKAFIPEGVAFDFMDSPQGADI